VALNTKTFFVILVPFDLELSDRLNIVGSMASRAGRSRRGRIFGPFPVRTLGQLGLLFVVAHATGHSLKFLRMGKLGPVKLCVAIDTPKIRMNRF
jgi:hypothetical protein